MKTCSKCKREFPATTEYFNNDKHRPDGLTSQCKECRYNREIFNVEKPIPEIIPDGYKRCVECSELLEIVSNFKTNKNSKDGFYCTCTKCLIKRREQRQGVDSGYKRCSHCNGVFESSRDFFMQESRNSLDGFDGVCLECLGRKFYPDYASENWSSEDIEIIRKNYENLTISEIVPLLSVERTPKSIMHMAQKLDIRKITSHIEEYNNLKYKIIDNKLHKFCKSCKRYLPSEYDYYPKDDVCIDGLRNVCRECKGEYFRVDSNFHNWSSEEIDLLIKIYSEYTNNELVNLFYPHLTVSKIMHKATLYRLYKNKEALNRSLIEIGNKVSKKCIEREQWVGENNPQHDSQRFGDLNPNYKGGISPLYQELRRNINQWKLDSLQNADYKCLFTGEPVDDIHHVYSFASIVDETLTETGIPLYVDISWYSNEELKTLIDKCLEIHYRYPLGVCMKKEFHQKFHSEFGYGRNTPHQFDEFINNIYNNIYVDLLIV